MTKEERQIFGDAFLSAKVVLEGEQSMTANLWARVADALFAAAEISRKQLREAKRRAGTLPPGEG